MTNNIKFELAKIEDILGIAEVQKSTWLATYVNEEYNITTEDILARNFTSPERIEKWQKKFVENEITRKIFIAKEIDKVIAFCVTEKGIDQNELKAIYVLPNYQGQGIGKKLIQQALDWLSDDKDITMGVVKYNNQAINFYQKFGFYDTGDLPPEECVKLPTGKVFPEIRMIRKKIV